MKWTVFLIYWISLVATMRQGQLWTWWFLVPTFVLLFAWAEDLEDCRDPAARDSV